MPWHIISLLRTHLFWTKCSLPCCLPQRKRSRKRRRVQSWDHWQLDVTKVNWNNRFLCVYILNGPLVSAVLGFLHEGKLGSKVAIGLCWKCMANTDTHSHCNEQVMLRHRLLKSVIIINLAPHLSIFLPSVFPFFPLYIRHQGILY